MSFVMKYLGCRRLHSLAVFTAGMWIATSLLGVAQPVWHVVDDMSNYFGESSHPDYLAIASNRSGHMAVIGRYGNTLSFVRASTDGGRFWRLVLKDSTIASGSPTVVKFAHMFSKIAAIPPRTLIVAGDSGIVCRSTDWGETWTRSQPGTTRTWKTLSMVNSGDGLLLQYPRHLLRTSDSGATWNSLQLDTTSWPVNYELAQAHMLSDTRWIFVFISPEGVRTGRTDDAGAHWTFNSSERITSLSVCDSGQVVTVGSGLREEPPPSERVHDVIQRSNDDGQSWEVIRDDFQEPAFGLLDVDFADNTNGVAVGRATKAVRTTDGGRSWYDIMDGLDLGSVLTMTGVTFPTPDAAFACTASGRVFKCDFSAAGVRDWREEPSATRMYLKAGDRGSQMRVFSTEANTVRITIVDMLGRLVFSEPVRLDAGETIVPISTTLSHSAYVVSLEVPGTMPMSSIIVPE